MMRRGNMIGKKSNFIQSKTVSTTKSQPMAFSFGDPESVMGNNITEYLGTFLDASGDYYLPPVSQNGLAQMLRANGHHGTIPFFKRNMLRRWYVPGESIDPIDLGKACYDYEVFGHCYFQLIENRFGMIYWAKHLPALNMRRMKDKDQFCMLRKDKDPLEFKPGEVYQMVEYDVNQSIYGLPQYIGGMQSVLLNQDATLFRRKYFLNGAHMGYVFYVADGQFEDKDEQALKKAIKESKGAGNFQSMFLNVPGGKPDSVKIIPIGDIATKDEFYRIKNISRNDILAMWRINGALAGILAENTSGYGDLDKITLNNFENEVVPRQHDFLQLNNVLHHTRKIKFTRPEKTKEK